MRADPSEAEVPGDGTHRASVHRQRAHHSCEHGWTCPLAIGFAELVRWMLDHDRERAARAKQAP